MTHHRKIVLITKKLMALSPVCPSREIIKKAIENHSKLEIEEDLDERTLLHSKIIRDADKLDNFRVKKEDIIKAIFPTRVNKKEDMEESLLSNKVYKTVLNKKCVDIHDRVTPLDFWCCILAFTFDLNFDVTYKIVKENDYMNILIDRFDYKDEETKSGEWQVAAESLAWKCQYVLEKISVGFRTFG